VPRHLVLVGMPGSGKSSVGKRLAKVLDLPFVDLDRAVERAAGRTIPELFANEGEPAFRALESAALVEALAAPGPGVIATGGGAVLAPANRAALRDGAEVVWLRARAATLGGRVADGAGRPLLAGDPAAAIEQLLAVRGPIYAEVADIVIDVDQVPVSRVLETVLDALVTHGIVAAPAGAER
jgi:shikimate kinase